MQVRQELQDYILKNGRDYTPAPLPPGMVRGKVGDCFDHCTILALGRKWRYVEGLALDPRDRETWILHAWLTDGEHAFDPTWMADVLGKEIPVPTIYFGIEMDIEHVAEFMISTRYKSVLDNAWRDPIAARAAAPGVPTNRP